MSASLQIVFCGEVVTGFRLEDVQRELGRVMQADEARLKKVFSGRPTVLKRGLTEEQARRYVARLAAMGAQVRAEPMPAPPVEAAPGNWPTIAPPPEADRHVPPPTAAPVGVPIAPRQAAPQSAAAPLTAMAAAVAAPSAMKELALLPIGPEASAPPAPSMTPAPDEVVCPKCGERQTRRVLCRSCTTNLEMALAAQQEEQALRRAERQAALEARRAPRGRPTQQSSGQRSAWPIGFSFSGRVGRLSAAAANIGLICAMLLLTSGFLTRPSLPRVLLLMLGALAVFFFSMRLTVLRFHDCDRHGWWALLVLVPYVGNLASLLIALLPGNPDENDYGPPPPRGRWRWVGVALVLLVSSSALTVRAGMRFVERYAEEQARQRADDTVQFDGAGSASVNGGSGGGAELAEAMREYAGAPGHKAFAASSKQTFAWVGNANTVDEAARDALAQCEARRAAYTPNCRVVSINGQPGGR